MSQDGVNKTRRALLVGATAGVGAVGAGFLSDYLYCGWLSGQRRIFLGRAGNGI